MFRSRASLLPATLAIALLFAAAPAAAIDKPCALEASGEACVYDITVTAAPTGGKVTLCSIPAASGAALRNTTATQGVIGAVSAVGTTTRGSCSGAVAQSVVAGGKYEAIISYEKPLPGSFPRSATARFTGSTGVTFTVTGPRPQSFVEPQTCTQITESTLATATTDVDTIVCGNLFACKFDPAGDTDLFDWTVPAGTVGWIKIVGPSTYGTKWCLYKNGTLVKCAYGRDQTSLLSAGSYRLLTKEDYNLTGDYGLSLQGVSSAYRCGPEIKCSDDKTGTFNRPADTDTLIFKAAAAMTLNLKIVGPSTYGTKWCVFGPTGTPIGDCKYGENTVSLPAAGTYIIGIVEDYNLTGGYSLSLQCL